MELYKSDNTEKSCSPFYKATPIKGHSTLQARFLMSQDREIQSNLSYVTFQGNIEIWSPKTGGH